MKLRSLTIRMTEPMYQRTKQLADENRLPHGEWIRRCMCWDAEDASHVPSVECPDEYKVRSRGRPANE